MPFKLPNAVQETTTTSGTGALTLLGAVASRKAFSSQLATGDTVAYVIEDGTDWEAGIGTFTAPSTLSRDTVIYSTNGNAPVVWPASGTRNVYVAAIGEMLASLVDPSMALGLIVKTADRTYAARSIAVSSDLSITNPAGTAGNPTLALAFTVTAFAKTLLDDSTAGAARATLGITLPYMWLTGGADGDFCTGGATRYGAFAHGFTGQVSEAAVTQFRAPAQGRLSNLRVRAGANSIGATSTFTIRVNNADTALSLSFNTLAASNTADVVTVNAGDLITIKTVGGGSSGSASNGAWSMKFEAWSW